MHLVERQIQRIAVFAGLCGTLYFLSLIVSAPIWLIWLALGLVVFWLLRQKSCAPVADFPEKHSAKWLSWLILATGMALITNRCYHVAEVFGGWDAWAMWNYKARAMTAPKHWHIFMQPGSGAHSDYPLMLPAINALFLRTFGDAATAIVPYVTALAATLLIPVWIFARLAPRHLPAASVILLLFATSDVYLFQGVSQYADVWTGFFFVAALFAHEDSYKQKNKAAIWKAGFFMGCCIWTKNEGLILALIATAFWLPELLRTGGRWRHYLSGAALPLLVWCIFKTGWPMPGDMLAADSGSLIKKLADGSRYTTIWNSLKSLAMGPLFWVQILFWLTTGACLIQREWPLSAFFLVITVLLAYNCIYLITPHDLDWHLATSQLRLVFQLVPALAYDCLASLLNIHKWDERNHLLTWKR